MISRSRWRKSFRLYLYPQPAAHGLPAGDSFFIQAVLRIWPEITSGMSAFAPRKKGLSRSERRQLFRAKSQPGIAATKGSGDRAPSYKDRFGGQLLVGAGSVRRSQDARIVRRCCRGRL